MKTFSKILLVAALVIGSSLPVWAQYAGTFPVVSITAIKKSSVEAQAESGTTYELNVVYDVYSSKTKVDGRTEYAGYLDSVYLKKNSDDGTLEFSYIWKGERHYLDGGKYLVCTGRPYVLDSTDEQLISDESSTQLSSNDILSYSLLIGPSYRFVTGFDSTAFADSSGIPQSGLGVTADALIVMLKYVGLRGTVNVFGLTSFGSEITGEFHYPFANTGISAYAGVGWSATFDPSGSTSGLSSGFVAKLGAQYSTPGATAGMARLMLNVGLRLAPLTYSGYDTSYTTTVTQQGFSFGLNAMVGISY